MFKKLIAVVALCLSVSFSYADKELNQNCLRDVSCYIYETHMDRDKTKVDDQMASDTYDFLHTQEGIKDYYESFQASSLSYKMTPKYFFVVQTPLIFIGVQRYKSGEQIIVQVFNKDTSIDAVSIEFFESNLSSKEIGLVLSSQAAQRAFKKAGITLTKKQIDSMVEVK